MRADDLAAHLDDAEANPPPTTSGIEDSPPPAEYGIRIGVVATRFGTDRGDQPIVPGQTAPQRVLATDQSGRGGVCDWLCGPRGRSRPTRRPRRASSIVTRRRGVPMKFFDGGDNDIGIEFALLAVEIGILDRRDVPR